MPKIVNTTLRAHQVTMTEFAKKRSYSWWLAGCSTGKTLAAYNLIIETGARKTLVLSPKAALTQAWPDNWSKYTEGLTLLSLVKGATSDKIDQLVAELLRKPENLVVSVNYETAVLMADTLRACKFDVVISDESHKLKSHNSKTSMNLALALNDVPMHVAMTATGWDDRPTDIYGQVRWLAGSYKTGKSVGSRFFGSWTKFYDRYVEYIERDNIKLPQRYINQEELRERIAPFTFYLNTEDVIDLPPEQEVYHQVEWTAELRKVYKQMKNDMLARWNGHTMVADNVLVQALRLQQLTGGYFTDDAGQGHFIASPKVDRTLDILDEIGGQPTAVFTTFDTDVQALRPRLESAGYRVKELTGRSQEHDSFQRGDGDVIIVNMAAGSASVELTRASHAIYFSCGNSRTNHTQSRWRIRRSGSDITKPITYHYLELPSSIDGILRRSLKAKGEQSNFILAGLQEN